MVERQRRRVDRVALIACGTGALLMTALTLAAADFQAVDGGPGVVAEFIALGLAPYALTALLSLVRPLRRLVVATTRAVAVAYGLLDCGMRYVAFYHPKGSTDALVVVILPFWWMPVAMVVAALSAATLWVLSRRTGRPAFD